MKKSIRSGVSLLSILILTVCLLTVPFGALADEQKMKTEIYALDEFEKASQDKLDLCPGTESMELTGGITTAKYLAEGATSAVKISYKKDPEVWGQLFLYQQDAEGNRTLPFKTLPEKMSEWDVLKFYIYVPLSEATAGMPTGPQLQLIDQWNQTLGITQVKFTWSETDDHFGWVELRPSDFVNNLTEKTPLTAFPDAFTFLWKVTGEYNEYDSYKPFNMYLSGMQMTREVPDTTPSTSSSTSPSTSPSEPPAEEGNPAPTDTYKHTAMTGLEKATQEQASGFLTSGMTLTAGITDKQFLASGAESALKIHYAGTQGWGQVLFYHKDGDNKTLPFPVLPDQLSAFDGIRFYLKAVSGETGLPNAIDFIFLDQYGMEIGKAKVDIYDESKTFGGWVYLTPEDFGMEVFPDAWSCLFKMSADHGEYDGYKAFDMYFSGLSVYTEAGAETEPENPKSGMPEQGGVLLVTVSAGLLIGGMLTAGRKIRRKED